MDENESVTWTLRCYAHNSSIVDISHIGAVAIDTIADSIDARFDALRADMSSLQTEHNESVMHVKELQAKLDASIPLPVDADGVPWTDDDVDKPFLWANDAERKTLREIAITWQGRNWCLVDDHDTHYPADKCRHVKPEPPDSQERIDADVKKGACEYFEHLGRACKGCPSDGASRADSCMRNQFIDLLRRQRELYKAGEQS